MQEIFILPASGYITIDIPAKFFYVKDITTPGASIRVQATGQTFDIDEVLGKGAKLSFLPEVVNTWFITNQSAIQQTVILKLGLVYYEEDSIVGDIDALVRFDDLTSDKNEFCAGSVSAGAGALYQMNALVNPAGSNKNFLITNLSLQSDHGTVKLTSRAGLPSYGSDMTTILSLTHNKYLGQANGAGRFYAGSGAVTFGTDIMTVPCGVTENTFNMMLNEKPFLVPPGYSFGMFSGALNYGLKTGIHWKEEPV